MMAQQASQVTAKMQGVLNNRDTEIMQRKAKVHKRLARHVARTCQARRRLCKVRVHAWAWACVDIQCCCCNWFRCYRLRAFFSSLYCCGVGMRGILMRSRWPDPAFACT